MTETINLPDSAPGDSSVQAQRPAIHRRISSQLYAGIFGAVVLTIVASVVSWISFNNVDSSQKRVSEESVPELARAFSLAEFSNALVAAAPRLTTAPPNQFPVISAEVSDAQREFQDLFEPLLRQNPDDVHVQGISEAANALERNIATITADMPHFYSLSRRIEVLQVQIPTLHDEVEGIIIPAIDDQLFFQVTGYRDRRHHQNFGRRASSLSAPQRLAGRYGPSHRAHGQRPDCL